MQIHSMILLEEICKQTYSLFDGTNERSVLIMDNCSIHHVDSLTSLFEEAGVLLLFLPPYSPDYMPIEEAFSYIKAYLRLHSDIFQVTRDPIALIGAAFTSITHYI